MSIAVVAVASLIESKTFTSPDFSATKTLPSGEKRTTVGSVRPEKTVCMPNPVSTCCAASAGVVSWIAAGTAMSRTASDIQSTRLRSVNMSTPTSLPRWIRVLQCRRRVPGAAYREWGFCRSRHAAPRR